MVIQLALKQKVVVFFLSLLKMTDNLKWHFFNQIDKKVELVQLNFLIWFIVQRMGSGYLCDIQKQEKNVT